MFVEEVSMGPPLVSPKEVEKVKKSDRSPSKEAKKGEGGGR